jgi:hypothetical protein
MTPGKRKRLGPPPASPSPRRKSARIAARSSTSAGPSTQPSSSTRQQSELSLLSTNTESSETWPSLAEVAKARIAKYQTQNRPNEDKLQSALNAFVQWLPEGGRESVARDIIEAISDEDLYSAFRSLFTALAVPSKSRVPQ